MRRFGRSRSSSGLYACPTDGLPNALQRPPPTEVRETPALYGGINVCFLVIERQPSVDSNVTEGSDRAQLGRSSCGSNPRGKEPVMSMQLSSFSRSTHLLKTVLRLESSNRIW